MSAIPPVSLRHSDMTFKPFCRADPNHQGKTFLNPRQKSYSEVWDNVKVKWQYRRYMGKLSSWVFCAGLGIRSSLFCPERREKITHSCSFVNCNEGKWVTNLRSLFTKERREQFAQGCSFVKIDWISCYATPPLTHGRISRRWINHTKENFN